ncbi:hypothetical protein ACT3XG_23160 [Paenibacillus polymyxa]|uniref:hypothetical protein n=1 Tax=Paenibacillus TaxID=44249 RepID=UPI000F4E1660|nr:MULTISPECIES: hypothetical protein [Paenibacillus]KAF6656934.1 hypothetical protein HFD99_09180 [Paenibacillus sp. EKM301P]RPD97061.1 hypothetical protein EG487_24685 [Paenibacillus polymyxa]UBS86956.1 hypothetical protein LAZ93_23095 [Paenibacillus polymyxa]WHX35533.1 hypothetical protein QNH38_23840 [Paenibacillus polymyxa]
MKPIKVITKTAILAAMMALLLPYVPLASASESPNPLSSSIQAEAGKWEKTDEITSAHGQVYKYIDPTSSVGEDVYYYYVNYNDLTQEKGNKGVVSPQSWGIGPIVKTNENKGYWVDTNNALRVSTYYGPGSAKLTVSSSITAQVEGSISGSAEAIEASMGFSLSQGFSLSDEYSVNVPKGERWVVSAFPRYEKHRLGVYDPYPWGDSFLGYVMVSKPVGVAFRVDKH